MDLGREASCFRCSMLHCRMSSDLPTSYCTLTDCGELGFFQNKGIFEFSRERMHHNLGIPFFPSLMQHTAAERRMHED